MVLRHTRTGGAVLTAFRWQSLKINLQTNVVVVLGCRSEQGSVLPLQDVVDTIPDKLIPATDVHGENEGSLAVRSGQVEPYAIEINKLNI